MNETPPPEQPAATAPKTDHPGVITHPPFIYITELIAGALVHLVYPLPLASGEARWITAGLLIALGIVIVLGGARIFRGAGTNIETNKPSTTVVTHGLYRFSRNPIYIGLTTLYLGLAYVANSWWTLILLIPVILIMRWGVIAREERYLEAKFGEAYVTYKARVRRWL